MLCDAKCHWNVLLNRHLWPPKNVHTRNLKPQVCQLNGYYVTIVGDKLLKSYGLFDLWQKIGIKGELLAAQKHGQIASE